MAAIFKGGLDTLIRRLRLPYQTFMKNPNYSSKAAIAFCDQPFMEVYAGDYLLIIADKNINIGAGYEKSKAIHISGSADPRR